MKPRRNSPENAHCGQCLAGQDVTCLVRSIAPPDADNDNPNVDLKKRKRGASIVVALREVYPQDAGGNPTEAQVTITGASPNTSFTAQVVAGANTGGHQHHDANRTKGTVAGAGPTSCTGSGPVTCATDTNGYAQLKYTSSEVGGWDNVLVKMDTGEEGDAIVKVRVPGLLYLPSGTAYTAESNDVKHPNYRYGNTALINAIQQIAQAYMAKYNATISVNDMSLINGGVFDVKSDWNANPHQCHRKGTSVDFNRKEIDLNGRAKPVTDIAEKIGSLLVPNNINCRRIVETDPTLAHFECPASSICP